VIAIITSVSISYILFNPYEYFGLIFLLQLPANAPITSVTILSTNK
jgi:hypothetical protein